jgi:membrane dipeptidase
VRAAEPSRKPKGAGVSRVYSESIVIDGLEVANWSRAVFEDMHGAGITAANCTCCIWEGFEGAMQNIASFKRWFREHDDLIRPVHTVTDIEAAKQEGRVGIILGWQNISGIEDQLGFLALFKELGVGIIQLAYNTQNFVGAGCYESRDPGLSDFGREAIAELNEVGILIDLSHVGPATTGDTIECSRKPVVFSHTCPAALHAHPRNKTDEEMRRVADLGGLVGVTPYPWFLKAGPAATLDDYAEALEHTLNVVGEDHVGIGTDFTDGHPEEFFEWIMRDKGYARRLIPESAQTIAGLSFPQGVAGIRDFPKIAERLEARGWPDERIRKVLGGNWFRVLAEVWPHQAADRS